MRISTPKRFRRREFLDVTEGHRSHVARGIPVRDHDRDGGVVLIRAVENCFGVRAVSCSVKMSVSHDAPFNHFMVLPGLGFKMKSAPTSTR